MANTFKVKTNGAMPASAGTPLTLYTCGASNGTVVLGLILCNIDTAQRTVDVQLVICSKKIDYQRCSNLSQEYLTSP